MKNAALQPERDKRMLFNSVLFWIFFAVVTAVYFLLRHRSQNYWLLAASWVFYSAWDWRFLGLLLISTLFDYSCARWIAEAKSLSSKRILLALSLSCSLGFLAFFKYFNFFAESLHILLQQLRVPFHPSYWSIVLPVGISFYTFQTVSYVIDVYRGVLKPEKSFLNFALYIAFFPQLVAGPIERAGHLLPQIKAPREARFDNFREGAWLCFSGLFKKVVLADNMAIIADSVFNSSGVLPAWMYLAGVYAFAFQIYGDFAGYTDIARGSAKILGFDLMKNFHRPYLAESPSDFWRRWHVSLSTWLRDYLYIPLGGNRKGFAVTCRNLMVTMLLGGLWHGAGWTFIVWGGYHGVLLVFQRIFSPAFQKTRELFPLKYFPVPCLRAAKIFIMFQLTCIGWIFFRAENIGQALFILGQFGEAFIAVPRTLSSEGGILSVLLLLTLLGTILVSVFRNGSSGQGSVPRTRSFVTNSFVVAAMLAGFLLFGVIHGKQFVYFQF